MCNAFVRKVGAGRVSGFFFTYLCSAGEKHVTAVVLGCRKALVGGGGQICSMHLSMNVENAPPTFGGLHFRQCSLAVFNPDSSGLTRLVRNLDY